MDNICLRPNDCYGYLMTVKSAFCDCRNTCIVCPLSSSKFGCALLKAMLCFVDNDKKK